MGAFNSVWKKLYGKKPVRILIQGLDAAGKTTMLYRLKLGEVVTTIPTIGFNVETVDHKNVSLTMWDVGGRDKIRPIYRHYYANTDGLIFVVDSADLERMEEIKEELHICIQEDTFKFSNVPILVVANKQDLPRALSIMSVAEKLELNKIKLPWYIVPAVAIKGDGLYEGLDWLCSKIGQECAKTDVTSHVTSSIKDVQQSVTNNKTMKSSWKYLADSWCTVTAWWGKRSLKTEKQGSPPVTTEEPAASG